MGIQDRDYWRERYWEREGQKAPERAFSANSQRRSFKIIDKVRVRPDNYVPDPVRPSDPQDLPTYSVGIALVLCVFGMLGFFVYKLFFS